MTPAQILAALTVLDSLLTLIPQWIANARAKGELTAEQEAEFQAKQAAVFAKGYAQPEPPPLPAA
jgi:hypothetical protein